MSFTRHNLKNPFTIKTLLAIFLFAFIVSIIAGCCSVTFAQGKNATNTSEAKNSSLTNEAPLLPAPTGFVNDFANILDAKTKENLEQVLTNFKNQSKIAFAVVTVKTTGDKTAFDYSLVVDGAGVLLLVAVQDRNWHIQISSVLEKVLPHEEVKQLGSLMIPSFKESKYGEGITKCVAAFIDVLKEKYRVE